MSLKDSLMPHVARLITSPGLLRLNRRRAEWGRRLLGREHEVSFYFRVDDPYSWLLAQVLPEFAAHYGIRIRPRTMLYLDEQMYPAPEMLRELAPVDARRLARMHGLEFPASAVQPEPDQALAASRILMRHEGTDVWFELAHQLCGALWRGEGTRIDELLRRFDAEASDRAELELRARREQFIRAGHYLTATLHYAGEWYWSVERLDHLASRLGDLGLGDGPPPRAWGAAKTARLEAGRGDMHGNALDLFFSFRSPYSYLALGRARALAQHYGLSLDIRPVMPMVMRGLPVPPAKKFYILRDAAREAALHGIPFGFVADPLGRGVERCMALWPFAEKEGRLLDYIETAARMIWSQGTPVATDAGLESVCLEAGLDWNRARRWLDDDGWRSRAERNRADMVALGVWGVPAFHYQGRAVWGQDRFAILEHIILKGEPS